MTQTPQPLAYMSPPKVSGMAKASMILGVLAIPTGFILIGMVLGILALIFGNIALRAIKKDPANLGGKGFADMGIVTGIIGIVIPLLIAVLLPSIGTSRFEGTRTYCAANINGVLKGMVVYGDDNADCWPIQDGTVGTSSTSYNLGSMYMLTTPAGGNEVSTKSFICKSDPDTSAPAPFGAPFPGFATGFPLNCSYGIANPTASATKVAAYWSNTLDSSIPVMSDLVGWPLIAGKPASTAGNSINHGGDGQNVGFGDAHAEWCRSVVAGSGDDISGKTGAQSFTPPFVTWLNPQKAASNTYSFK